MASVGRECVDGAVVDLAERRQVRNAERVEDAAGGLTTRQDEVGIARAVGGEASECGHQTACRTGPDALAAVDAEDSDSA